MDGTESDSERERIAIAVRALGDMKNSGFTHHPQTTGAPRPPSISTFTPSTISESSFSSSASTTPSTSSTRPLHDAEEEEEENEEESMQQDEDQDHEGRTAEDGRTASTNNGALSRTLKLPMVESALRVYEQGKERSRVVKYASNIMESSLSTLGDKLPSGAVAGAARVDEYVGRGWGRLDAYRSGTGGSAEAGPSRLGPPPLPTARRDSSEHDVQMADEDDLEPTKGTGERSRTPTNDPDAPPPDSPSQSQNAVAQRSRWHAMLLEAGGLSAALSDESMRRLRFVLGWLQYATNHIDQQILVLRDFIASMQRGSGNNDGGGDGNGARDRLAVLQGVKSDIVQTVRQVVGVVSKYAGGVALSDDARGRVRGFVLGMPSRWARANVTPGTGHEGNVHSRHASGSATGVDADEGTSGSGTGGSKGRRRKGAAPYVVPVPGTVGTRSRVGSRRGSVSSVDGAGPSSSASSSTGVTRGEVGEEGTRDAAQRLLTLATESLDMMRGVTGVVKDSLDRADAWVERLRGVGLQRQGSPSASSAGVDGVEGASGEGSGSRNGVGNGESTLMRMPPLELDPLPDPGAGTRLRRAGSTESLSLPGPASLLLESGSGSGAYGRRRGVGRGAGMRIPDLQQQPHQQRGSPTSFRFGVGEGQGGGGWESAPTSPLTYPVRGAVSPGAWSNPGSGSGSGSSYFGDREIGTGLGRMKISHGGQGGGGFEGQGEGEREGMDVDGE